PSIRSSLAVTARPTKVGAAIGAGQRTGTAEIGPTISTGTLIARTKIARAGTTIDTGSTIDTRPTIVRLTVARTALAVFDNRTHHPAHLRQGPLTAGNIVATARTGTGLGPTAFALKGQTIAG